MDNQKKIEVTPKTATPNKSDLKKNSQKLNHKHLKASWSSFKSVYTRPK